MSLEIKPTNKYNELKMQLLSGELGPEQVRNSLIDMDQETPERDASVVNYEFLTDPDVVTFIESQPEDIQKGYYRTLSFTELHIAQREAFNGNNEKALEILESSLEHAIKDSRFPENIEYRKGMIAYFKKDTGGMQSVLDSGYVTETNRKILKNMLNGLTTRGYVNYAEDYRI